jgi:hypothetical protein
MFDLNYHNNLIKNEKNKRELIDNRYSRTAIKEIMSVPKKELKILFYNKIDETYEISMK